MYPKRHHSADLVASSKLDSLSCINKQNVHVQHESELTEVFLLYCQKGEIGDMVLCDSPNS